MPAYNFQRQFVPMILSGQKPHTIRRRRKYPTKVGDVLKLFIGMRTKNCRQFAEAVCVEVEPVIIYPTIKKIINGFDLMDDQSVEALAKADGFDSADMFFNFFDKTYGEYELADFEIIHWDTNSLKALEVQGG